MNITRKNLRLCDQMIGLNLQSMIREIMAMINYVNEFILTSSVEGGDGSRARVPIFDPCIA